MRFRAIFQPFIPLPKVTGRNSVTLQRTRIKKNDKLTMNLTVHTSLSIRSNKSYIIISMLLFIVVYGSIPTIITCFIKKTAFQPCIHLFMGFVQLFFMFIS